MSRENDRISMWEIDGYFTNSVVWEKFIHLHLNSRKTLDWVGISDDRSRKCAKRGDSIETVKTDICSSKNQK